MCFVSSPIPIPIPTLLLMALRKPPQTLWYHLVLSWRTMVSEVNWRGVQESKNIDYAKQHHTPHCRQQSNTTSWRLMRRANNISNTHHCWLPAKVMHPANSTKRFSWLTHSTSIWLMKNVHIFNIN